MDQVTSSYAALVSSWGDNDMSGIIIVIVIFFGHFRKKNLKGYVEVLLCVSVGMTCLGNYIGTLLGQTCKRVLWSREFHSVTVTVWRQETIQINWHSEMGLLWQSAANTLLSCLTQVISPIQSLFHLSIGLQRDQKQPSGLMLFHLSSSIFHLFCV